MRVGDLPFFKALCPPHLEEKLPGSPWLAPRGLACLGIASDACMVDEETFLIAGGDATIRVYNWQQERK